MKHFLVVLAVTLCGCGPKCIKSHWEPQHVEEIVWYMQMGDILMPMSTPAHDEMTEVCDWYEGQK